MKKYIIYNLLSLLFFVQFLSCKKDELEKHPEIQTISVTALSPFKVSFKGNVINKGDYGIIDYGFIYGSTMDIGEAKGTKISLGKDVSEGEFTKDADNINLYTQSGGYSSILYARAYLTNEKGTAFGKVISVNVPSPSAGSITPSSGKSGDRITINGKFYSPAVDQVEVTFNDVKGKVLEATDDKIILEVPSGISAVHGSQIIIRIKIGNQVFGQLGFNIMANIKDFFPKSGPVGTLVSFTGDNLPSGYYYPENLKILFGEIPAYSGYNVFQVAVPPHVTTEKLQLSFVLNSGVPTVLPGEFTVTPPVINSISPASGIPGTYFIINCTNLPPIIDYNYNPIAILGDVNVNATYISNNQMAFNLPADIPAGEYTFTLKIGPHTINAAKKIKVLSYSVTTVSPTSGGPGTEINITGTFLNGQGYNVYFGSIQGYGEATSATNLKVQVPGGIDAGKVKIAVELNGQKFATGNEFTMLGPSITSFSPTSGVAGSVVTIVGTGFGSNGYYPAVKFGTTTTDVISFQENTIKVNVPSNLNPGAMKISVVSNGQTVVSTSNFTVVN